MAVTEKLININTIESIAGLLIVTDANNLIGDVGIDLLLGSSLDSSIMDSSNVDSL